MDKWTVFLVIAEIVAFLFLILKPVISLNSTISNLNSTVKTMTEEVKELKEQNQRSHKKIWEKTEAISDTMDNHETRITVLESERKYTK